MAQLEHEITEYVPETDPLVLEKLEQWQDLKVWFTYDLGTIQSMGNC